MIALFAVAALLGGAMQTPEDAGRTAFNAGLCSGFGWRMNEAGLDTLLAETTAANLDLSDEVLARRATAASTAANADVSGRFDAIDSRASFDAWAAGVERTCDTLVADYPLLLQRTPETASRWGALLQAGRSNYPQ